MKIASHTILAYCPICLEPIERKDQKTCSRSCSNKFSWMSIEARHEARVQAREKFVEDERATGVVEAGTNSLTSDLLRVLKPPAAGELPEGLKSILDKQEG